MNRIYNNTGVGMAAFLGGPLAAGYLFYKNYQVFNKIELSRRAILISVLITVIVFGSIPFIPVEIEEKIPNFLLPIIFLGISRLLADRYQKEDVEAFISEGGEFYSNWRTAGISLIFAAMTLIAAIIIFILTDLLIP